MSRNGETVSAFEREFAAYVGAKYAIALCNGTATLHTALVARGVKPGDRVAVPPLTMSATTIAVLHAGATPVFVDVDERTWLMRGSGGGQGWADRAAIPVSLYGLHASLYGGKVIDDAAQTLRPHNKFADFTSYSFQASKILSTGEGGMLVTNDEELATRAREFSSLGYRMRADQPRIDPAALKSPTFDRHYSLGWNYRMNDLTAMRGLELMPLADYAVKRRREFASLYAGAVAACDWLTTQYVPDGWTHDYWTYAVACDSPDRALRLADAVVKHGGERPYPAWRLTFSEPAFRYLLPKREVARLRKFAMLDAHEAGKQYKEIGAEHGVSAGLVGQLVRSAQMARHRNGRDGICPVAESLQPRLLQFQTNDLASAERNAGALRKAIEELS